MRYLWAIAVTLLVATSGARAAADMAGLGTSSCASFAKAYQGNPAATEDLYMQWAAGFMTAWNIGVRHAGGAPIDLSAKTFDQHKAFIRDYCNGHPLASYSEAVVELLQTLPAF